MEGSTQPFWSKISRRADFDLGQRMMGDLLCCFEVGALFTMIKSGDGIDLCVTSC